MGASCSPSPTSSCATAADAEDVVIETLLTAFEKGGSIRDERALRGWLLKVATNQALGRRAGPDASSGSMSSRTCRHRRHRRDESRPRRPPRTVSPTCRSQMRAAIVLRYYADLSVDEVATTLGKSPNTIKAQLQTALDRLRVHLAEPVGASLGEARHA